MMWAALLLGVSLGYATGARDTRQRRAFKQSHAIYSGRADVRAMRRFDYRRTGDVRDGDRRGL